MEWIHFRREYRFQIITERLPDGYPKMPAWFVSQKSRQAEIERDLLQSVKACLLEYRRRQMETYETQEQAKLDGEELEIQQCNRV